MPSYLGLSILVVFLLYSGGFLFEASGSLVLLPYLNQDKGIRDS